MLRAAMGPSYRGEVVNMVPAKREQPEDKLLLQALMCLGAWVAVKVWRNW